MQRSIEAIIFRRFFIWNACATKSRVIVALFCLKKRNTIKNFLLIFTQSINRIYTKKIYVYRKQTITWGRNLQNAINTLDKKKNLTFSLYSPNEAQQDNMRSTAGRISEYASARKGSEVVVTRSTRNRVVPEMGHVGSNPTLSAIYI